jgi:assimilatory nitrate reductase catalytic subunit
MSKVENLEQIIEAYGPHLHDAPYGGWRADRVIDRVVPTHCPYCAVQCGMNLLVERDHVVGFEPRYDFPVNEGRLCPKGVTAYLQVHHPDRCRQIQGTAKHSRQRLNWRLFRFVPHD